MGRNPTLPRLVSSPLLCPVLTLEFSISHHVLWLSVYTLFFPIWLGASWRQGWWFIDLCSSDLHNADIQYIFEWISEWTNEWITEGGLCLSLFYVFLFPDTSLWIRDHPLYSKSGTVLCLLFRLSGGRTLKARSTYLTSSHRREVVDVRESVWNASEIQAHPRFWHPLTDICNVFLFLASH